nr:MAG TPA: hypothetical protein [Caudoviricetes sp.]
MIGPQYFGLGVCLFLNSTLINHFQQIKNQQL